MSYDFTKFKEEKEKIINYLSSEYRSIQTGTASPQVLDLLSVDSYGSKMSISHIASVGVETPANLLIVPYDKSLLKEIEKVINEADLGLSTSSDSIGLRVFFPKPTTESRQKMVKLIKEKLEEARVKVRNVREDSKKEIEKASKDGEFGKDEETRYLEELQEVVNEANRELEDVYNKKEKDILGE
ncbi:MAG TPA: ribosome recycling factor [Candidatus Paceibacterota bacterium]|nr:ribosome recycling factor [Candidatus Paceibacterota bacterium]HQB57063.1 ribosome recycling factor [Candidatus Paceibacterota bacterium]